MDRSAIQGLVAVCLGVTVMGCDAVPSQDASICEFRSDSRWKIGDVARVEGTYYWNDVGVSTLHDDRCPDVAYVLDFEMSIDRERVFFDSLKSSPPHAGVPVAQARVSVTARIVGMQTGGGVLAAISAERLD